MLSPGSLSRIERKYSSIRQPAEGSSLVPVPAALSVVKKASGGSRVEEVEAEAAGAKPISTKATSDGKAAARSKHQHQHQNQAHEAEANAIEPKHTKAHSQTTLRTHDIVPTHQKFAPYPPSPLHSAFSPLEPRIYIARTASTSVGVDSPIRSEPHRVTSTQGGGWIGIALGSPRAPTPEPEIAEPELKERENRFARKGSTSVEVQQSYESQRKQRRQRRASDVELTTVGSRGQEDGMVDVDLAAVRGKDKMVEADKRMSDMSVFARHPGQKVG